MCVCVRVCVCDQFDYCYYPASCEVFKPAFFFFFSSFQNDEHSTDKSIQTNKRLLTK